MAGTELSRGALFTPELAKDLVTKVRGKSSVAKLSATEPIPFNGLKEFTFTMDSDIDVVAENGRKGHGGVTVEPVTIVPIKVEYGARITDEFIYSAQEEQIALLEAFNDGFAKKIARGLDLMAFHGINPRTGSSSTVIGANHFDAAVTQIVSYAAGTPEENIEAGVALVRGAGGELSGMAMDPTLAGNLAALKVNGVKQYPELAWGANPGVINGLSVDVNSTVYNATVKDRAIVGDFANSFKWGYAKEIPLEVIRYGDPDGSGKDLKAYNQVYIRAEAYLGWAVMNPTDFARIVDPVATTFVAVQEGGVTGTTNTTSIKFTFSKDVYGLSAANITLTDGTGKATKGVLTGSGKTYSLTVTAVEEGNIAVKVADIGGYTFPAAAATVAVYAEA